MHGSNYHDPSATEDAELLTEQWRIASAYVLAFLAIMSLILCYYVRHLCSQEQRDRRVTAAVDAGEVTRGDKLKPEVLASLPIFVYDAVLWGGEEEKLECAICLAEFREGEKGRMLPRCGHRFHAECVDMWFETHSSCPLCRVVVAESDCIVDESVA